MAELLIREAVEEDVGAILVLYREAGVESEQPFTAEEGRAHLRVLAQYPSYRIFVAVIDSAIVGTYELLLMDNLAKRGRRSGVVEDVAVSPRHQGLGVGRALMDHAMRECRAGGCYKLVLSSGLKRTGAHDFYDAVGFERHGYSFRVMLD